MHTKSRDSYRFLMCACLCCDLEGKYGKGHKHSMCVYVCGVFVSIRCDRDQNHKKYLIMDH